MQNKVEDLRCQLSEAEDLHEKKVEDLGNQLSEAAAQREKELQMHSEEKDVLQQAKKELELSVRPYKTQPIIVLKLYCVTWPTRNLLSKLENL